MRARMRRDGARGNGGRDVAVWWRVRVRVRVWCVCVCVCVCCTHGSCFLLEGLFSKEHGTEKRVESHTFLTVVVLLLSSSCCPHTWYTLAFARREMRRKKYLEEIKVGAGGRRGEKREEVVGGE